jgi:hypothetical protein
MGHEKLALWANRESAPQFANNWRPKNALVLFGLGARRFLLGCFGLPRNAFAAQRQHNLLHTHTLQSAAVSRQIVNAARALFTGALPVKRRLVRSPGMNTRLVARFFDRFFAAGSLVCMTTGSL